MHQRVRLSKVRGDLCEKCDLCNDEIVWERLPLLGRSGSDMGFGDVADGLAREGL